MVFFTVMKSKITGLGLAAAIAMSAAADEKWFGEFQDAPIKATKLEQGWPRTFMERQRDGLGTYYAASGYPYDTCLWTGKMPPNPIVRSWAADWWPYEQAGYLVDGLGRVGIYLDDARLGGLLRDSVDFAAKTRTKEGWFGPDDTDPWANSVFARAMMAAYDATGDRKILDALAANSLAVTNDSGRAMCTAEADLFLYRRTGDARWIEQMKKHMKGYPWQWRQLSRARQIWDPIDSHGVTAAEIGKLPCLYFLATGDRQNLKDAVTFFEQVMFHNELADGVPSSEEGYAGNGDKTQSPKDRPLWDHGGLMIHETCDIVDHMWTFGYLLMATGDPVWGDRIERMFLNAAPGAISEDWRSLQYFSSPNQVFAGRKTGHPGFGEVGLTRQAYRPGCDTECCAGNAHRLAPVYAARMWMLDSTGTNPAAMLYGNSSFSFTAANGAKVRIEEWSRYPAGGSIRFVIQTDRPADFSFACRIPRWAEGATLDRKPVKAGTLARLERTFRNGDVFWLELPMRVRQERHSGGVSVYRGPILYSLPIAENDERVTEGEEKCSRECPAHYLTPASAWNYAMPLFADAEASIVVEQVPVQCVVDEFEAPRTLVVPLYRRSDWVAEEGYNSERTPSVPPPKKADASAVELRRLVPMGSTRLRISVFPIAE